MKVVYGMEIKSYDDEFIESAEGATESAVVVVPGKFLVDVIPAC